MDSVEVVPERKLWKVVIALAGTEAEAEEITDRFVGVICADPNHKGPCAIPWSMHVTEGESLSKAEQRRLTAAIDDTMAD